MSSTHNKNLALAATTGIKFGLTPGVRDNSIKLKNLIAQGWRATYAELFGQSFVDSLDSAETDDKHHSEAIEWHWNARIALLEGKIAPNNEYAYFPIWARGNFKSGIAELMVVIDAVLSVAYNQKGYCLYIGREKDRVKENIGNLEALLSRSKIREYCPELSEVARNEETNSKRQWTGTFLYTKAGYIIKGATVESAQAGSRIKHLGDETARDTRVTFFVPDDIDSRDDSPVIAETRFKLLTTEILPMKQENTLTFFAQNLISRFSVMYRIQKGGAKVLTNRKLTQPIPAVRNLVTEQRTVNGIVKDVVLSGQCTWRVWNLVRVQNEIDTMGLSAFLREMQHEVEQSKEGVILYNYDDNVHVISESEFNAVYGKDTWKSWRKKPGNDWARTKTDKHANVAGWLTVSSQNTPLPNFTFFIEPMSFPANSSAEDVAERLLSALSPFAYDQVTWRALRNDVLRRTNANIHTNNDSERIDYEHGELSKVIPRYSRPLLQRCNVQGGEMSHEQDTVRKIYARIYSLAMRATNPKKHGGTELINRAMRIDWELDHPFRPGEKGYTQWFLVAPDDRSQEYREGIYRPKPYPEAFMSDDLHDSDLARFQFKNVRYAEPKLTETGERIDEPLKMFDDFFNLMQMFYVGAPLAGDRLTLEQKVNLLVPQESQKAYATASTGSEKLTSGLVLEFEQEIARNRLNPDEEWEEFE